MMETKTSAPPQEEFVIVERFARIVSSVRGAKPDYTRLAAELEPALPFDIFGIVLLRHDRMAVRVTACHRQEKRGGTVWVASRYQHPREGSMLGQLMQAPGIVVKEYPQGLDGPPIVCGDALSNHPQLRSTLIAPLMVDDRVFGALELGSMRPAAYARESLQRLVDSVARVLATAIESAQLGRNTEIQDRQREALKHVSSALTSKMELSQILDRVVQGVASSLNVASAIVLYDRREDRLRPEAHAGLDEKALTRALTRVARPSEQCIFGYTILHRQPCTSNNIATDDRFPHSRVYAEEAGIHSIYTYPLTSGSTVYGVLLLCSPEPGGFTPLKADILSLFASQATIAIHNGMLLESARQRGHFQETIEQLEGVLQQAEAEDAAAESASHNLAREYELFKLIREQTRQTFGVSFASLLHFMSDHLLTSQERTLQALFAADETQWLEKQPALSAPPLADTLTLLTHAAEAALVRAGMLGELSRLLVHLKQSTSWVRDPWFVVDLAGRCIYLNQAAEALCGVRQEDIESASAQMLPHIERVLDAVLARARNADDLRLYLRNCTQGTVHLNEIRCVLITESLDKATNSTSQDEHRMREQEISREMGTAQEGPADPMREANASDDHYRVLCYPLHEQQGRLMGMAIQMRDITEQVRDERNMAAFLSSVSHDLRTPLTTIKAAVTGLLQPGMEWSQEDEQEMLAEIDSETDHLTVMINALIEMSRIEMGALVLEREWCDVVEIASSALSKLDPQGLSLRVRLDVQPHLPLAYVDYTYLEKALCYLIENALRSSPGGSEVLVSINALDEANGQEQLLDTRSQSIRVRVIDHGPAIPESEQERVFRTFHNAHSYDGGLGLAICKGILEAHQGRIWLESPLDPLSASGSCFGFTVPSHPYGRSAPVQNALGVRPASPAQLYRAAARVSRWSSSVSSSAFEVGDTERFTRTEEEIQ